MRSLVAAATLLAAIVFARTTLGDELCLTTSQNGRNETVECVPGGPFANDWVGYSASGTPCSGGGSFICNVKDPNMPFAWSISTSSTNASANVGSLPTSGVLYLWTLCSREPGMLSAEFGLTGDLTVIDFVTMPGFLNNGTPTDIQLVAFGCPPGYDVLVAEIHLDTATGVVEESGSESWGRLKSLYE